MKEQEELAKAGVVAFAFGTPKSILPNRRIGKITERRALHQDAVIYTQTDVPISNEFPVEYTEEVVGEPPPTLRIARGAVQWAQSRGISELWVVAAKPHLWRAVRDMTEAVKECHAQIKVCVCTEVERYPERSWFCLDSTQERVRSCTKWNQRELILRVMPFWVYKRVAG